MRQKIIADSDFCRRVYEVVATIPKGRTMTYKEVALETNSSPRAVGQALKKNPNKHVPCHRVISASGDVGGYRGMPYSEEKIAILKKEGICIVDGHVQKH